MSALSALVDRFASLTNLRWQQMSPAGASTYKNGIYCGPGWGFTYRDILDGKIMMMPEAIDAIDAACRLHDECYHDEGYFVQGCNLVLIINLVDVVKSPTSTPQQRRDAMLMAAVFFIESQTVDLAVGAKRMTERKYKAVRDSILGYLAEGSFTLEQAIKREIMLRSMGMSAGGAW
jgi:hypothetical protein